MKRKEKKYLWTREINMAVFCGYISLGLQLYLVEKEREFEELCLSY